MEHLSHIALVNPHPKSICGNHHPGDTFCAPLPRPPAAPAGSPAAVTAARTSRAARPDIAGRRAFAAVVLFPRRIGHKVSAAAAKGKGAAYERLQ